MREGYWIKRDDRTMEPICVGRVVRGDHVRLERWDGERWVDWPQLLDATGIGGAESWWPASPEEAAEVIGPDALAKTGVKRAVDHALNNYRAGKIEAGRLAEFALLELADRD